MLSVLSVAKTILLPKKPLRGDSLTVGFAELGTSWFVSGRATRGTEITEQTDRSMFDKGLLYFCPKFLCQLLLAGFSGAIAFDLDLHSDG